MNRSVHKNRFIGVDGVSVFVDRRKDLLELPVAKIFLEPTIVEGGVASKSDDVPVVVVLDNHGSSGRLAVNLPGVVGEHERFEVVLRVFRVYRYLQPTKPKLRLQRLLGVLLLIEIDRELDVIAIDRRVTPHLTHDAAGIVYFVRNRTPLAVEFALHAELDPKLPNSFVEEVAIVTVIILAFRRDPAHIAHYMTGQRRIRVDPTRLFNDGHTRQIFYPLFDRDGDPFVDVLSDWHWQKGAVDVALESGLHLFNRHVYPPRQPTKDLCAIVGSANNFPINANGEHPLVVGNDPAIEIENPAALRK